MPRSRTSGSSPSTDHREFDPWQECAWCGHARGAHVDDYGGACTVAVLDEDAIGTDDEYECDCGGFQEARS